MILDVAQDPCGSGETLMKRDRELLELAASGKLKTHLRFYQWERPTISLGFHQQESLLDHERMSRADVPWVRRPTGGAAVLHSEELTYAIILAGVPNAAAAARLNEFVGRAITNGLRDAGVEAQLDARGEPLESLPNRTSCFVRTSRWEVTVKGRKIVGSAQRNLHQAMLQHGSILTGPDHLRIVDFLTMKADADREPLKARLESRSTSVAQELGQEIDVARLRGIMEQSFQDSFARFELSHVEMSAG